MGLFPWRSRRRKRNRADFRLSQAPASHGITLSAYKYIHLTYTIYKPILIILRGEVHTMERVNALKLRNNFGEILDRLSAKGDFVFYRDMPSVRIRA